MLMRCGDAAGLATSRNVLLRSLSHADAATLSPHLRHVTLPRGTRLLQAAERIDMLYFPETGLLALGEQGAHHGRLEIAVVGREGVLGWPALLGSERGVHDAVVQGRDGTGFCIAIEPLLAAARASPALWGILLGAIQAVMIQMARTIVSTVENSLEQRIARWLLMRHDRIGGDHILIRHEEIAEALSARRASITDRLHILEGERLVRCRRGRIIVRDRPKLEAWAGAAYGPAEAASRIA